MSKDQKRPNKGRRNRNNKRDEQSQDHGPMTVIRRPTRLHSLRVNNVVDFQGQPMIVRALEEESDGIKLSLSRALKAPLTDRDVKVGRANSSASYEAWSFTTRPMSMTLILDRFVVIQDPNPEPRNVKRRKRSQASDRMEVVS